MQTMVKVMAAQAGAVAAHREAEVEDQGIIEEIVMVVVVVVAVAVVVRLPRVAAVAGAVRRLVHHESHLLRPVMPTVSHARYRCREVTELPQASTHNNRGPAALYRKRRLGPDLQTTLRQADYPNVTVEFPQVRSE